MSPKPDVVALIDLSSALNDAQANARSTRNLLAESLGRDPLGMPTFLDFADGVVGETQLKERLKQYREFKDSQLRELIAKDPSELVRHLKDVNQLYAAHVESLDAVVDSARACNDVALKEREYSGYTLGRLHGAMLGALVVLIPVIAWVTARGV